MHTKDEKEQHIKAMERLKNYEKHGFPEKSINDEYFMVRLQAYIHFGLIHKMANDKHLAIQNFYNTYLNDCKKLLDHDKVNDRFTEEEAVFLRLNKIMVDDAMVA